MQVSDLQWTEKNLSASREDILYSVKTPVGIFTVLDRLTGFGDYPIRDVETGFRDNVNKFWLASGGFDIREYPDLTLEDAAKLIKNSANTCIGV